jgi:hypothetical protein
MKRMKRPVLVLLALLALVPSAALLAQTGPAAAAPAPDVTQFLATLGGGPAQTAGPTPGSLVPAPSFMTSCTSSSQCPTGQLCCNVCGNPPDGGSCLACTTPIRGHCPFFP